MPRLAALGGLALFGDDGPLAGPAARGRNLALLVILARAGKAGVTREKLCALLWPESDADRARHSFDQALYRLRRALGQDALVAGGTSFALNPEVISSDVAEFAAALGAGAPRMAVGLYAGEFLDGFHLSGSIEFERWVDDERAALRRQYATALESLAREAGESGDTAAAASYWRQLAVTEPLSSRVALGLMQALEAAGDRAAAIRFAGVHEARVRDDLDTAPDPSVVAFREQLRSASALPSPSEQDRASAVPRIESNVAMQAGDGVVTAMGPADGTSADPAMHLSRRSTRLWLGAATAAVLIVAAYPIVAPGPEAGRDLASVRIVPFANETGDSSLGPVGRLAADDLTRTLLRTGLVRVLDGTIGGPADADVSGRFYRVGDSLRIEAVVNQPRDGIVLDALEATAPAEDPSRALEPLRQRVLGALAARYDARLASLSRASSRPPDWDAYREFAAGIDLFSFNRDLAAAASRFEEAARIDPEFIQPHLWLAWTWQHTAQQRPGQAVAYYARADSIVADLHASRGDMSPLERAWHDRLEAELDGRYEDSYRAARTMADLAPASTWVVALADAAFDTHRPAVVVETLRNAGMENLGPESAYGWFMLTVAYHMLGQYEEELEATDEAVRAIGTRWEIIPAGVDALAALGDLGAIVRRIGDLPPAAGPGAVGWAIMELRAHGFVDDAASLWDRLSPTLPPPAPEALADPVARRGFLGGLYEVGGWADVDRILAAVPAADRGRTEILGYSALMAAREGDSAKARRLMERLPDSDAPYLFGEPAYWRARIEAVLGNHDEAIDRLRHAFEQGLWANNWHMAHMERDFEALRSMPAYRRLMRPRS